MKAIWTGAIGFGLVNIPVKLYSAVQGSELDLDMLDKKDHANIKFQRVNEVTGEEVPWGNIVKGVKHRGEYVVLTDKDFEKASPVKSKTIHIEAFVPEDEIDPMYYETPYYLEPERSGARAYALLHDALEKSGRAAVGSFVLRSREHLCVLRAHASAIVLNRIRFAEEIRDMSELKVPSTKPKAAELKMAMSLIDQLAAPFNIKKFKDTYTQELRKLIKAKATGKKVEYPKLKVTHRKSKDLMSQLKASLKKAS